MRWRRSVGDANLRELGSDGCVVSGQEVLGKGRSIGYGMGQCRDSSSSEGCLWCETAATQMPPRVKRLSVAKTGLPLTEKKVVPFGNCCCFLCCCTVMVELRLRFQFAVYCLRSLLLQPPGLYGAERNGTDEKL